MKNATAYARRIQALLKRVRRKTTHPTTNDPTTELVLGFLQWNCTRKKAAAAFARLMRVLVDVNDLRVSHTQELVSLIGPAYPRAEERVARLHDALQDIFVREHTVSLDHLAQMSKKDARHYLDTLPGMAPYVAARVMLLNFGGHAIPVDDHLAAVLRGDGLVDAQASIPEIESFLEHHVKAGEALAVHTGLQAWAEGRKPRDPAKIVPPQPVKSSTANTTRKITKKK